LDCGEFKCKWIDPASLWNIADEARIGYWPEANLPVNSESIVEFRLRLDIEPIKNLLSTIDIDAYLKRDLSGIVVDCDCYLNDKFANRMRFSFAHELGHLFLHKDLYLKFGISSVMAKNRFLSYPIKCKHSNLPSEANNLAPGL
jgi:hypothetical protein